MNEEISGQITALLNEIKDESSVSKNVKIKIDEIIQSLKCDKTQLSVKISKLVSDIDELAENPYLPSYVRPQLWNLISLLENI